MTRLISPLRAAATGVVMMAFTATASIAGGHLHGVYKTQDTSGTSFDITLNEDKTATATQGEGLKGTWAEDGDTAVITWDSGWTTKLKKGDAGWQKMAYKKGSDTSGEPTHSTAAEKVGGEKKTDADAHAK